MQYLLLVTKYFFVQILVFLLRYILEQTSYVTSKMSE